MVITAADGRVILWAFRRNRLTCADISAVGCIAVETRFTIDVRFACRTAWVYLARTAPRFAKVVDRAWIAVIAW